MKIKRALLFFIFFYGIAAIANAGHHTNNNRYKNFYFPVDFSDSLPFLINEYSVDISDLDKVYIFPHSPEYFSRFTTFYSQWLDRLKAIDFNSLNVSDRVDYLLLKRNIRNDQYDLEHDKNDYQKFSYALPFADKIVSVQQQRRRGQRPDAMATAKVFNDVQTQINKAKTALLKAPLADKDLLDKALEAIKELREGLKNVYTFYMIMTLILPGG